MAVQISLIKESIVSLLSLSYDSGLLSSRILLSNYAAISIVFIKLCQLNLNLNENGETPTYLVLIYVINNGCDRVKCVSSTPALP